MAPLASMLARVSSSSRSRFALPAAGALSRAARSGDLILGSDASKRQLFGCAQAQHTRRSFCTHSSSAGKKNLYNEFFYEEKDMESDEALWALYHRWCKHHEVQRDHDDMVRRFDEFKCCVHLVHEVNNTSPDLRLELNRYSDTTVSEMYGTRPMMSEEAYAWTKAMAKSVGGSGFTMEYGPPADGDDDDSPGWVVYYSPPDDD